MKHLSFLLLVIMLLATAQVAFAVVLESGIPGGAGGSTGLAAGATIDANLGIIQYIRYLYLFVLGFVGIAGLVTLVIWGTVWTASGVIDKKAMAMEGIKNTLMGLGVAFTAYLILFTINPDLTVIRLPPVTPVTINTTKPVVVGPVIKDWKCAMESPGTEYKKFGSYNGVFGGGYALYANCRTKLGPTACPYTTGMTCWVKE